MRIVACSQTDVQYEDDMEYPLLDKSLFIVVLTSRAAKSIKTFILQRSL